MVRFCGVTQGLSKGPGSGRLPRTLGPWGFHGIGREMKKKVSTQCRYKSRPSDGGERSRETFSLRGGEDRLRGGRGVGRPAVIAAQGKGGGKTNCGESVARDQKERSGGKYRWGGKGRAQKRRGPELGGGGKIGIHPGKRSRSDKRGKGKGGGRNAARKGTWYRKQDGGWEKRSQKKKKF